MEIRTVSKDNRSMELEFLDRDENFLILLQEELLKNKKVDFVYYKFSHPVLGTPTLTLRMKPRNRPETALKNAAQSLIKGFENIEVAFENASA